MPEKLSRADLSAVVRLVRPSATREGGNTKAEQSRVNGSKSNGPSSPAGKQASKEANMVHGFRSSTIAIHSEDKEAYDAHLDSYLARDQPIDKVESDLVGLLAVNMFQIMRITSIEAALFDLEIALMDAEADDTFDRMDNYGRLALAFKKSAGDNVLDLLRRYKTTAERAYHRALQAIETIKKERPAQQPVPAPASEKPISADEPEKTRPDKTPPNIENAPEPPATSVQPVKTVLQLVPKSTNPSPTQAEDPEWGPKFGS